MQQGKPFWLLSECYCYTAYLKRIDAVLTETVIKQLDFTNNFSVSLLVY